MKKYILLSIALCVLASFGSARTASALSTTVSASANASTTGAKATLSAAAQAKLATRIDTAKNKASEEIDRRVTALNRLIDTISAMTRVTTDEKTKINTALKTQIEALNNLKVKITSESDIDVIKTDVKSITQSYRIFALVLPQGRIMAEADAIVATADMMGKVGAKLDTRIKEQTQKGTDVTEMTKVLVDYGTKLTDAQTNAQTAVSLILSLNVDNGDKAIMKTNADAFASARAKLKTARTDLKAAREDATKILKSLRAAAKVNVTASSTTSVQ